jgi:hypothetical protein
MVDEISSMKVKIFLMIGTQILSWMSLVMVTGYFHFSDEEPPPMTFEVFALIVIPVNSLLNPIFYSGLYSEIRIILWAAWLRFAERVIRFYTVREVSHVDAAPPGPGGPVDKKEFFRNRTI